LQPGDVLTVWRLDRLGRSMRHLVSTMNDLAGRGAGFQSITEAMDTTTAGGELLFHVMGALAQFERRLIAERSRAGIEAARRGTRCASPLHPRQARGSRGELSRFPKGALMQTSFACGPGGRDKDGKPKAAARSKLGFPTPCCAQSPPAPNHGPARGLTALRGAYHNPLRNGFRRAHEPGPKTTGRQGDDHGGAAGPLPCGACRRQPKGPLPATGRPPQPTAEMA
jgi:hypothetical protein